MKFIHFVNKQKFADYNRKHKKNISFEMHFIFTSSINYFNRSNREIF